MSRLYSVLMSDINMKNEYMFNKSRRLNHIYHIFAVDKAYLIILMLFKGS